MKKESQSTVWWWMGWIVLTILSFFVSSTFWTGYIAKHIGSMDKPGVPIIWVTAVFGSWMVLLVPLIIVMYNKVDRAYEDARISRENKEFAQAKKDFNIRSILIEESKRRLTDEIISKLKNIPTTIPKGHLVTARLRDGRSIENVFVLNKKELLGVYDRENIDFDAQDIQDVTPSDLDKIPVFETERWLRLDGVSHAL